MAAARPKRAERAGGRVIDIDAARAARAEAAGEPVVIRFGGKDYEMPSELPARALLALDRGDTEGCLSGLLGARVAEIFLADAAWADVEEFVEAVPAAYGLSRGE